jgi:hypothetical protein
MVRFDFFYYLFSVLRERDMIRDTKKKDSWNKPTLDEGEVSLEIEQFLLSCIPIDAASDASIVDSSIERKVTPMGSVLQVNPTPLIPIGRIGKETLHLGINNTKTLL